MERGALAYGCVHTQTHTHMLFWRFCCFLSFNQTVHEKQEEKEEELRPTGTQLYHTCSHSYTHSHGQACAEDTHIAGRHYRGHRHTFTQIYSYTQAYAGIMGPSGSHT